MPLTVTLEISDAELDYFRSVMSRVREHAGQRLPHEVAQAAATEVARLRASARSPFVARRIDRVGKLIAMLEDGEWALPDDDRLRVLDALAYVAEAQDLVPDSVPVLGMVDDAIMLELVLQELQHELDGYEEFDEFRRREAAQRTAAGSHKSVSREDWLASKRLALHDRMRARRERDAARNGDPFPLITSL